MDPDYILQQRNEIKHLVAEIEDANHRLMANIYFLLSFFCCELSYDHRFVDELNAVKETALDFTSANQILIQRAEEVIRDMDKPFEIGIDHYWGL